MRKGPVAKGWKDHLEAGKGKETDFSLKPSEGM